MTKEEKILNDGLEKVPEKKDNTNWISSLAFFNSIGCSPFWAKVKLALSLAYYRITAFFIPISKSARLQSSNSKNPRNIGNLKELVGFVGSAGLTQVTQGTQGTQGTLNRQGDCEGCAFAFL